MGYQENIAAGLARAYDEAPTVEIDPASIKLVIFSDHHKGRRDQADDFLACESAYLAALRHYHQRGFSLAILGDSEELWENRPEQILPVYRDVTRLERSFHQDGSYLRFFGNHDDEWCYAENVRKHLEGEYGKLQVYESMRLRFSGEPGQHAEIFLVHGHQGTLGSDRFSWLSRWIVRYFWRPFQRLTNIHPTTPSTDWRLRYRHEVAMYNWAIAKSGVLLITGHTHHPIFPSHAWLTQLIDRHQELRRRPEGLDDQQLEQLEAEIAYARQQTQPCYFNTGCCSFADGSITGIEITSGQIKLIRWSQRDDRVQRETLDRASLAEITSKLDVPAEPISEEIPSR